MTSSSVAMSQNLSFIPSRQSSADLPCPTVLHMLHSMKKTFPSNQENFDNNLKLLIALRIQVSFRKIFRDEYRTFQTYPVCKFVQDCF